MTDRDLNTDNTSPLQGLLRADEYPVLKPRARYTLPLCGIKKHRLFGIVLDIK